MDDTLLRTGLPALALLALASMALALGVLGTLARRRLDRARAGTSLLAQAAEGDLVVEVQICAHDLVGAGETILAVMAQHSSGVGAQIAAVAETTATVEEVKVSAQHARQLAESVAATAREADRIAAEGVAAIQDATVGMTHIRERVESIADQILALSEQSQQIGEIIATVGDLADQSNMLALNAAIEAARAG